MAGLYACPTVVNNVETIASVPSILTRGAEWFRSMGTEKSPGFKMFAVSGHVANPGVFEMALGCTLRELLDLAGGVREGHELKFWLPGGSSVPWLTADHLDTPMTYEDMNAAGTFLGTATVMVFDETTSVVRAATRWVEFYKHESCGKCTPCREGGYWLVQLMHRFEQGQGSQADLETLEEVGRNMIGRSFCALGDSAPVPIQSALKYFKDEFMQGMTTPSAELFDPMAVVGLLGGARLMTVTTSAPAGAPAEQPIDLVSVTIDGIVLSVPKGTLVIRAAEQLGIAIPRFCDHPLLDPAGACRQCLVEVEGQLKPLASCTTTVTEGMVVRTQLTSEVAADAQHGVMELLLINHPLDCPVCDKGGECPLQNQAMSNGRGESRFDGPKRTFPKPVALSSQVLLDRERCISCARCTRFADQIAGDPFIELVERGAHQQIAIASDDQPFNSYFSGNTVQICPVGALTGTAYRFRSRPFDLVSTPTACEHCASGCALRTDTRRGSVLRRLAGDDPAVNEEWNCDKGRWAFHYASLDDRLTVPLVRDADGTLVEASWPEALDAAARGLAAARAGRGVGVLVGGRSTVEDAYAYSKFARTVLGTNDVDFRARPHSDEESDFLAAFVAGRGVDDAGTPTYADLDSAPVVLLVGLEPEDESPIIFLRLRKAMRHHRTPVVAVGSVRTRGLTKMGGRLLTALPGAEGALLDALASGDGLDETGTDVAALLRQPGAVVLVGERLAESRGALSAAGRLATATGARLGWVPRRAGERGALEAGALPQLLPGGRPVADAAARVDTAAVWGVAALPSEPGRDTASMLAAAADGQLDALVIGGVDPDDLADPAAARAAIEAAGFVVSLELRLSAVTAQADVVLPVAPVAEKSGTFVDWEGRGRVFPEVLRHTFALTDAGVLTLIAEGLGADLGLADAEVARAELAELEPWTGARVDAPSAPSAAAAAAEGAVLLATWRTLLDAGSLQDGEPHLAGTARPAHAHVSSGTAAAAGLGAGDLVTVASAHGSITVPVAVGDVPDGVVWLPTNSVGCAVRRDLRVGSGASVTLSAGGAS